MVVAIFGSTGQAQLISVSENKNVKCFVFK